MEKTIACLHCRKPLKGLQDRFCCNGCEMAYNIIHSLNLDLFYKKAVNLKNPPPQKNYVYFGTPHFEKKHVQNIDQHKSEVQFLVDGIHCSACLWLIETALNKQKGVHFCTLNYTSKILHISFNPQITGPQILATFIDHLGYSVYAIDKKDVYLQKERKTYYYKFATALFCALNLMWISIALYSGGFEDSARMALVLSIAQGILATPVVFYSGSIFLRGFIWTVKNYLANMDFLVYSGALLTYFYSVFLTFQGKEPYFDSSAMAILFVLCGKFLQNLGQKNIHEQIQNIQSQTQNTVKLPNGDLKEVHTLEKGEIYNLCTGEMVGVDSILLNIQASFNYSVLTGETREVLHQKGDIILSGAILYSQNTRLKTHKTYIQSYMSQLLQKVQSAASQKGKLEQTTAKIAIYFSNLIVLLSMVCLGYWGLFLGKWDDGILNAITVLIVACPCALALATPSAFLATLNLCFKNSFVFKQARDIETFAKIQTVLFDKTGTLTTSIPSIKKQKIFENFDEQLLAQISKSSLHPFSKSLSACFKTDKNPLQVQEHIGLGLEVTSEKAILGSAKFLKQRGIFINPLDNNEYNLFFAVNQRLFACFYVEASIKKSSFEAIKNLKKMNLQCAMLTGDTKKEALKTARRLGINPTMVFAQLKSEDKQAIVQKIQQKTVTLAIGDGLNDLLFLKTAHQSVALKSGSTLALEIASAISLNDNLNTVVRVIHCAKECMRIVWQNLGISLFYNIITIYLAFFGDISPLVAAVCMSLSSAVVVLNSTRILKEKF